MPRPRRQCGEAGLQHAGGKGLGLQNVLLPVWRWVRYFAEIEKRKVRKMTKELAASTATAMAQLGRIEQRIATHMQHAGDELLGVGMCLIEAKEQGLVPHGQWVGWVQQHTGMSERQAQRLMQAAREILQGSVMSTLPFSKMQTLLALPEPQREEMAQRAEDESLTVKQLREEVKKALALANEEAQKLGAQRARASLAEEKQREAERKAAAYREAQQRSEARLVEAEQKARKAEQAYDAERKALTDAMARMRELEQSVPEGTGISPEAQAEIDRLRAEIATQEDYLEQQAEKRQRAERELLQLQQQVARGETGPSMEGGLTLDAFAEAARVFVGKAGPLPHMGGQLSRMLLQEREAWQSYVDMVAGWLEAVQVAMNAVEGVVIHER